MASGDVNALLQKHAPRRAANCGRSLSCRAIGLAAPRIPERGPLAAECVRHLVEALFRLLPGRLLRILELLDIGFEQIGPRAEARGAERYRGRVSVGTASKPAGGPNLR
jgi:hypothetical protein